MFIQFINIKNKNYYKNIIMINGVVTNPTYKIIKKQNNKKTIKTIIFNDGLNKIFPFYA